MASDIALFRRLPTWAAALVPLVVVGAVVAIFLVTDPIRSLNAPPPVEEVTFERTILSEGEIALSIRNAGPDPVRLAQVLVNDAYRPFEIGDPDLGRLESTTVTIPYPWEDGLPIHIALVTSTGVTLEHEIEAATLTPRPGLEAFWVYALLGIYIGVIPVAAGLLWFPSLRRAGQRTVTFVLALTAGLLAFLLIDTVVEGLELASLSSALDGVGLFGIGAIVTVLLLNSVGESHRGPARGFRLAALIAFGIGLHNLGEGLAVGAATAAGEVALGTTLVIGFMLHNTTEGLAIVAPLADERPPIRDFVLLGALAGVPTIAGGWLGGLAFRPAMGALFFGIAAGAIAQVVWAVLRNLPSERPHSGRVAAAGVTAGLLIMYLTGMLA